MALGGQAPARRMSHLACLARCDIPLFLRFVLWGHVVDRCSPVRLAVPGPAAGTDGEGIEGGRRAVRRLNVLAGEVVLTAHEDRTAVVAPARPEGGGGAGIVLVFGEAVLRRLAEVGDVDGGLQ